MNNKKYIPIIIVTCLLLSGCALVISIKNKSPSSSKYCSPVPEGFSKSDLVGTWEVNFGGRSRPDTLTLRDDGTYKQLFTNSDVDYRYESPWFKWWLEDRPTGEPYLHLEKMLFCGDAEDSCIDPNTKMGFYDACTDKWLKMNDEFILAVIGYQEADKDIGLQVLLPSGWDVITDIYTLQEVNNGQ